MNKHILISSILVITLLFGGFFAFNQDISVYAGPPPKQLITPVITYPPDATTDYDKLQYVYSLASQLIDQYNSQREKAIELNVHEAYWAKFKDDIKPLLAERNKLRQKVIDASGIDIDKLELEDSHDVLIQLWGDKTQGIFGATYNGLDDFKNIDIKSLPQLPATDPYEDFTTYTELDPRSEISVDTNKIDFTAWLCGHDTDSWVYIDKGVGHFDGDFDHLIEFLIDAHSGTCQGGYWAVSNGIDDALDLESGTDFIWLHWNSASNPYLRLREWNNGSSTYDDSSTLAEDTLYFVEVERDEDVGDYGHCYAYTRTTSHEGDLVDTLDVTLTEKQDFQYYFVLMGNHYYNDAYYQTGYIQNYDLQEGGIVAPTVTTNADTNVEETTVTLNGTIDATGGENVTRWFYWDTDLTAPFSDNWSEGVYGTGAYSHGLTSLNQGDKYAFMASANNTAGTGNGSILYFMTKPNPATNFISTDNGTSWISCSWDNGTAMDLIEIRYASGASAPSDNSSGTLGYWGTGSTANISGLNANTQYSFRIFTHALEDSTWSTADNNPTFTDITDALAGIYPPIDFTLTDLGAITVEGEWTLGLNSTYTMIRVSRSDYPTLITEGELAYYGANTSDNWTGYSLDVYTYYFSAWGFDSDNITYSSTYTTASIGGEGMEDIATQLTLFNTTMTTFLDYVPELYQLTIIALISILAFWGRHKILLILAGMVLLVFGFAYWGTSEIISIILVIFGIAFWFVPGKKQRQEV